MFFLMFVVLEFWLVSIFLVPQFQWIFLGWAISVPGHPFGFEWIFRTKTKAVSAVVFEVQPSLFGRESWLFYPSCLPKCAWGFGDNPAFYSFSGFRHIQCNTFKTLSSRNGRN